MQKKDLIELAYTFYPRGISSIIDRESYMTSPEYKKLSQAIQDFREDSSHNDFYDRLLAKFSESEELAKMNDTSLLEWEDRCLTFELDTVEDEKLVKVCLNVSVLTKVYIAYVMENQITLVPYQWVTLPRRKRELENGAYKAHLEAIDRIMQADFGYTKISQTEAAEMLPDLAFQDIPLGQFNLFNAFFLNDNKFE